MKTQSTSSTLPQSNKESFSPMFKQLPVPKQSGLKISNNFQPDAQSKYSIRSNLHYRSNFQENNMQYQFFKVFFKDSEKKKHVVDIENDYEYSQTCDFVDKVIRQLNEQYDLNLPSNASNYRLYFAKKNGQRNSNYPEIDMHNTNIQTAMKFHDKNLFRLKIKSSNSQRNSFMKDHSMNISQNGENDIQISQGKQLQSSKGKNLDRSVLTNITNNTTNDRIDPYENKKIPFKDTVNQESGQTGFFSCFRFC